MKKSIISFNPFVFGALAVILFSTISFVTCYIMYMDIEVLASMLCYSIMFSIVFAFLGFALEETPQEKPNSRLVRLELKISLILISIAFLFFLLYFISSNILVSL